MKLKKLIPLVAVSSVVATIAPLTTSCAKEIEYKTTYEVDLSNPKFDPVEQKTGESTLEDATDIYFDDIIQNNKIFAYDFMRKYLPKENDGETYTGRLTFGINSIDKASHRISAMQHIKGQSKSTQGGQDYVVEMDVRIDVINVPFKMDYQKMYFGDAWAITSTFATDTDIINMKRDSEWQVVYRSYLCTRVGDKETVVEQPSITIDSKSNDANIKLAQDELITYFSQQSYYFENVEKI